MFAAYTPTRVVKEHISPDHGRGEGSPAAARRVRRRGRDWWCVVPLLWFNARPRSCDVIGALTHAALLRAADPARQRRRSAVLEARQSLVQRYFRSTITAVTCRLIGNLYPGHLRYRLLHEATP